MMTGRVSCIRFLALTLPSSNFSTTSSAYTHTHTQTQKANLFFPRWLGHPSQLSFKVSSQPFCALKYVYIYILLKDLVKMEVIYTLNYLNCLDHKPDTGRIHKEWLKCWSSWNRRKDKKGTAWMSAQGRTGRKWGCRKVMTGRDEVKRKRNCKVNLKFTGNHTVINKI